MSRSFTLNQLTEGIRDRHVGAEASRIQEKWTRTGLLRGLQGHGRENMARLMENQAAQVLREANTLAGGGNIDGFTNIAFPIVRRVFGGLVANELVSIQPMSLPSGLLFYLDYTYGSDVGGDSSSANSTSLNSTNAETYTQGDSIYGNPDGSDIRTGADAAGGQYDLVGTSFSQRHQTGHKLNTALDVIGYGAFGSSATQSYSSDASAAKSGADGKLLQFDPQVSTLIDDGGDWAFLLLATDHLTASAGNFDPTAVKSVAIYDNSDSGLVSLPKSIQGGSGILNVRRLNQLGTFTGTHAGGDLKFTADPFATLSDANTAILCVVSGSGTAATFVDADSTLSASFAISDTYQDANSGTTGATITIPSFGELYSFITRPKTSRSVAISSPFFIL